MKIVTLPTALLGLAVVALLDRRQLVRVLAGTVITGSLYVLITVVWVPWEEAVAARHPGPFRRTPGLPCQRPSVLR